MTTSLGELQRAGVLTMRTGFAHGGFNETGEGIPHLRPYNITADGTIDLAQIKSVVVPRNPVQMVQYGDVLFNNTNTDELVGKTAYFAHRGDFFASNHMTVVRILDAEWLDAEWLAHTLHRMWRHGVFKALCRRYVGQASVGLEKLSGVALTPPPIAEQRAIAEALRTAQAAGEARRREIARERERKAALMHHLFTHGTHNEPTRDTEIGPLPENWRTAPLGEIARVVSGGTPDRTEPSFWGGDIPWVKTGEINYGTVMTTEERITDSGLRSSSARILPSGTVLMAMYGQGVTRGRVAVLGIDAAINQACAALLLSPEIDAGYLFHFLAYRYDEIRTLGHGANQKNLNAQLVKSIAIVLPPIAEQCEIASVLQACDTKIAALEREAGLHDELFRAMLDELMSGRLSALPLVAAGGAA